MTDELKKRIAKLREITPRLNSATDQASRLVAMVEKVLVEELHVGIAAESTAFHSWSAGRDEDGSVSTVCQALAFGRVGGAFRIHVVEETSIVDDDGSARVLVSRQETPWPSCGRETKLRAFEKLPELLDNIIKDSERLAETAAETASTIREVIGDATATGTATAVGAAAGPGGAAAPQVAPHFMTCPWCSEQGEWLNVGSNHWAACRDCHCKWPIGTNLVPPSHDETEDDWQRNAKLLAKYEEAV
jgi:hypothetical protein